MKVRVLAGFVAVAMLVGVGSASAQSATTFAVKGGPNFASVSGNPAGFGSHIDKSQKIDVTFGGQIDVPVNDIVAFQPEFLYQRLGFKIKDLDQVTPPEFTGHIDYVSIPLLLKLGHRSEERAFYFLAGPTIDFITRAKFTGDALDPTEDPDFKKDLKTTVFGLSFGVGMTINQFLVEYRYSFGLNDIIKPENVDPVDPDNKIMNQSSAIFVGYSFGHKK